MNKYDQQLQEVNEQIEKESAIGENLTREHERLEKNGRPHFQYANISYQVLYERETRRD